MDSVNISVESDSATTFGATQNPEALAAELQHKIKSLVGISAAMKIN